jgi:hypothetical protein
MLDFFLYNIDSVTRLFGYSMGTGEHDTQEIGIENLY